MEYISTVNQNQTQGKLILIAIAVSIWDMAEAI